MHGGSQSHQPNSTVPSRADEPGFGIAHGLALALRESQSWEPFEASRSSDRALSPELDRAKERGRRTTRLSGRRTAAQLNAVRYSIRCQAST